MFRTLPASRARPGRPLAGAGASALVHAGLVALSIAAVPSARPIGAHAVRTAHESLRWVAAAPATAAVTAAATAATAPARPAARARRAGPSARARAAAQLQALLDGPIPAVAVPELDLGVGDPAFAAAAVGAGEFATLARGQAFGETEPPPVLREPGHRYRSTEVEKVPLVLPSSPRPRYPTDLLVSRIAGEVLVQFVVDTTGRPDVQSLRVLQATHRRFADEVRWVVKRMRFLPGEIAGQRVAVVVEQPFRFEVR